MAVTWAGWHFSDAGWCCPPDNRFQWYETEYFLAREEYLDVVKGAENHVTLAVLREPGSRPRPVLVGPRDTQNEGCVWVTDVESEEWVPLKEAEERIWARPVVIRERGRRKRRKNRH